MLMTPADYGALLSASLEHLLGGASWTTLGGHLVVLPCLMGEGISISKWPGASAPVSAGAGLEPWLAGARACSLP